MIRNFFLISIFSLCCSLGCSSDPKIEQLKLGAERTDAYLEILKEKKVGLLVNHTSRVGEQHLVDFLLQEGVEIEKIFAPEHGFRGTADAGELIEDNVDAKTGIQVVSMYGANKKPSNEAMKELDVVIFDIQDVGTRFYTYISSMHYMMEACAKNGVMMLVFDRPNPNGHYIDGPIREPDFVSFVGMHPIPVVHALTVGELALMINGEGWLENGLSCDLQVISMEHYTHSTPYSLPVKPSPNLPNDQAIQLYPSICFFEGTHMSLGRGTVFPFQVLGYPDQQFGEFTFTPESIDGMAKHPRLEGEECFGVDLRNFPPPNKIDLSYVIRFYKLWNEDKSFFTKYFNTLAGTASLKEQIEDGWTEAQIRDSWSQDLADYKEMRSNYLLYKD